MQSLGARFYEWLVQTAVNFDNWLGKTPAGRLWNSVLGALDRRPDNTLQQIMTFLSYVPTPVSALVVEILSAVTDIPVPPRVKKLEDDNSLMYTNVDGYMTQVMQKLADMPEVVGAEELLGGLLDGLLVKPLEDMLDRGIDDPSLFIQRVHGVHASLTMAAGTIGLLAEITGVGQIKTVSWTLFAVLESMGLSRIGFRAIAPLMEVGVNQAQNRIYAKRYRPYRWTVGDLMKLYALREITDAEFRDQMAYAGYRDDDIDKALRIAEQRISAGDVLQAYNLKQIDVTETVQRLHDAGIAPNDIQFLITLEDNKRKQSDLDAVSAIADGAFKKGLISEARYRQMKAAARVPQDRIDLQVQMIALQNKSDNASLKVSEIEQAFKAGILSQVEADHYLLENNIDDAARPVLIATWSEQIAPKHLALNSGNILAAYSDGIFTRNDALEKLKSVGWSADDATLQIELTDARNAEHIKSPTETAIVSAYIKGLLSRDDAITSLTGLGLSNDDAVLVLRVADLRPTSGTRLLTETQVVKLVKIGEFSLNDGISYLAQLGYDNYTAQLYFMAELTAVPKTITKQSGA
jgi:hypothetical protein